jgi:hypothetical protein
VVQTLTRQPPSSQTVVGSTQSAEVRQPASGGKGPKPAGQTGGGLPVDPPPLELELIVPAVAVELEAPPEEVPTLPPVDVRPPPVAPELCAAPEEVAEPPLEVLPAPVELLPPVEPPEEATEPAAVEAEPPSPTPWALAQPSSTAGARAPEAARNNTAMPLGKLEA